MNAAPADQSELHDIVKRTFSGASGRGWFIEDEKQPLRQKLQSALPPDVAFSPAVPEIGFVHRRTSDADIYFLANTSNTAQHVEATFRVSGRHPEWWDPISGDVSPAKIKSDFPGGITVSIDLDAYASRVLVFSKRSLTAMPVSDTAVIADISTGWSVKLGENGTPFVMDQLRSWTDDETTRYFSGTASYEKEVTLPAGFQSGNHVLLSFGEGKALTEQSLRSGMQAWFDPPVREAAVVFVNGKRAGSIWCPPYSIDVGSLLRPGSNKIRVVVANLALNYMAGHRLPDYRLLNLRYGERFQAQDMDKVQPVASGLFGPIRLIARKSAK